MVTWVDLHAAVGEQFLHIAVRQRKAQVPAHGEDDHVGREAEASEGRPGDGWRVRTAGSHVTVCLRQARSQQMQQRPVGSRAGATTSWVDYQEELDGAVA